MDSTVEILEETAHIINTYGLHTSTQFAADDSDAVDICAAVYLAAEGTCPPEFSTDETTSIAIIEASAKAMTAIKAISDALDSDVNETEIVPGLWVPEYIEHVSNWAATPPIGEKTPPSTSEVIGRIHRAANTLRSQTSVAHAA
ncbi:hypothetical protein ACL07V_37090 [Streptomyces sp. MB22_4]|uniref:DUF6197 family protein n=1 Tax=Streptomyces sp. MB22_4 TaxID=3383120 RepID=UPI0039A3EAC5